MPRICGALLLFVLVRRWERSEALARWQLMSREPLFDLGVFGPIWMTAPGVSRRSIQRVSNPCQGTSAFSLVADIGLDLFRRPLVNPNRSLESLFRLVASRDDID